MAPPLKSAGMRDYLREAFFFRWNLLLFVGSVAAAAMTPTPVAEVLLPLVAAGEISYLTGLVSMPRFRAAIDAKVNAGSRPAAATVPAAPAPSLRTMPAGRRAETVRAIARALRRDARYRCRSAGGGG
jgi:hypothetical protein